jgi:hypothetical protein
MSFERFSSSDIYMFEHVSGFIQCCGCWFGQLDDSDPFPEFNTPLEALAHLDVHENAGHDIGEARERIIEEYPDLDVQIEPYVQPPDFHEKLKAKILERWSNYEQMD